MVIAFTKEKTKAAELRGNLKEKVKRFWNLELEVLYPALVVRTGLGATLEVTPLLRDDEDGVVDLLGSDDVDFLTISDGDLYTKEGIGGDIFNFQFESNLLRAKVRKYDSTTLRLQLEKIEKIFPVAKVTYLFDVIPGDMSLGLDSKVFMVSFPDLAWMDVDALLAVYSFLTHPEAMKEIVLGGGANYCS